MFYFADLDPKKVSPVELFLAAPWLRSFTPPQQYAPLLPISQAISVGAGA
jgi:hypothetical protein